MATEDHCNNNSNGSTDSTANKNAELILFQLWLHWVNWLNDPQLPQLKSFDLQLQLHVEQQSPNSIAQTPASWQNAVFKWNQKSHKEHPIF